MLGILRTPNFFRTKGTKGFCISCWCKFCCQFLVLSCCCDVGRPSDLAVAIVSCLVVVVAAGGRTAAAVVVLFGVGVR